MDEEAFLSDVLLGRDDAVLFCRLLFSISQAWDDLIDRDKEISGGRINQAFVDSLLRLPVIPFYVQNFSLLHPIVQMAVYDWLSANELERKDEHEKTLAFVLRDSLTAVVVQCAYVVGGHEHAMVSAPKIRRFFHDEALGKYLADLDEKESSI